MAVSQYQRVKKWNDDTIHHRSTLLIDKIQLMSCDGDAHDTVDGTFANLYQLVHKLVYQQ